MTSREWAGGLSRRLRVRMASASRSTVISALVVIYVFTSGVTWAMTTPIGGVADEPSHIIYAAGVVRGDLGDLAAMGPQSPYFRFAVVEVPRWVASTTDPPISLDRLWGPCNENDINLTANCATAMSRSTDIDTIPTSVTRYPPPYYVITGWPTLVGAGESAVYLMRFMSALLAATLITLGLMVASPRRRTWLALGAAIAFTPTAAHFAGGINPSGFEIAAALGLGIALMGIEPADRDHPARTAVLVAVLVFAVAWSRPQTYLTLLAVIAAAALVNAEELRTWIGRSLAGVWVAGAAIMAFGSALIYDVWLSTPGCRISPCPTVSTAGGPAHNVTNFARRFVELGLDLVGRFGWLEHAAPILVRLAWAAVALSLLGLAIAVGRRRDQVGLTLVVVGALILAPLFVIATILPAANYQARYHLPLAVLVVIGAVVVLARAGPAPRRAAGWNLLRWGAVLAPVAMLASIAAALYRHSIGGQARLVDLPELVFGFNEWLPPPVPLAIAFVGVVAIAAIAVALGIVTRAAQSEPSLPNPST